MEIRIKRADVTDLDELMRWREVVLREVFSIPKEKNMDDLLTANREYYHTALKREEHIACFAYTDEYSDTEPVGCGSICLYQEMPSPDNPTGKCAYLMNIYTIPAVRQHGVGKAVVEWLVQEAKRRDAGKIYLESSEKAKPLYKELGFYDIEGYYIYRSNPSGNQD